MAAATSGIIVLLVLLGGFALWLWALIDVVRTPDGSFRTGSQLVWVLVVLLAPFVGAIVYLTVGRPAPGAGSG